MRHARAAYLFPLLLALPFAPPSRAAATVATAALPALSLIDSVTAHYARMTDFRFEGVTHTSMRGGSLPAPIAVDVGFLYAARFPSRVHNAMSTPGMSSTIVADGESLWVWAPDLRQYVVQAAPHLVPGQLSAGEFGGALQPLQALSTLSQRVARAEDAGADTIQTAGGAVRCRKLVLTYASDTSASMPTLLPRVLWVDEERRLVLRDSITIEFTPQAGSLMRRTQDMRFVLLDPADGGADSLYRFQVPAAAARVEHFGNAPPARAERSDLVGKPAKDFTLPALAGPSVKLSALRGKVVVLDFWATWCGPCRRWMPIVAKFEQRLKGSSVRFFAVNLAESPEQVRHFLTTAGNVPPVLLDRDSKVANAYGASSIPLTVVVGRDGTVKQVLVGLHPEEDLRVALVAAGVKGL